VTPFAVVTAAMFTVARLQHANEVVPMLFVGRSIRRVLLPVLLLGAVAGVGMAACWEWVVPHVGSDIASAQARLKQGSDEQKALVHERDENGERQYFYAWKFLPRTRTIERVGLLVQGDLAADCQLLSADSAQWDEQRRDWRLVGGRCSRPGGGGNLAPTIDYAPREWLERPDLTPELLMQQSRDSIEPELLGYSELWQRAAEPPRHPPGAAPAHHASAVVPVAAAADAAAGRLLRARHAHRTAARRHRPLCRLPAARPDLPESRPARRRRRHDDAAPGGGGMDADDRVRFVGRRAVRRHAHVNAPQRRTNGIWIIAFALVFVAAFVGVIVLAVRDRG
jgi:hypothetical protein